MRRAKWRRRIALAALAGAIVLIGAYALLTRPVILLGLLSEQVGRAGLDLESVGGIWFDPARGVVAEDLVIRRPRGARAVGGVAGHDPPLVQIPRLEINLSLARLFSGDLRPRSIDLFEPHIQFLRRRESEDESLWAPARFAVFELGRVPEELPAVRIHDGVMEVAIAGERRSQVLRRWVVDARIDAARGEGGPALDFAIDQVGGSSVGSAPAGPRQLLWMRWEAGLIRAKLGWVDAQWMIAMMPTSLADALRAAHLKAHFRADALVYDADGIREASLVVERLSAALPVEPPKALAPGQPPYVYLREGQAAFHLKRAGAPGLEGPTRIEFELDGRMHEGTLALRGACAYGSQALGAAHPGLSQALERLCRGDFGDYQLAVDARGISFPSAERHAAFATAEALPDALRAFLRDYQPAGPLNLTLDIRGGAGGEPRVTGVFEPVGASCRYFRFPYPMEDVRGVVRITPDGMFLEGLNGRHGSGRIRGDGKVDNTHKWTGFDLVFNATNLAMDQALYEALPPSYQSLWAQVRPVGLSDVTTRIRREDGADRERPHDPEIEIDARLLSGSLDGPDRLRLTHADGRIHISDEVISLDDFAGRDLRSAMGVEFEGRIEPPRAEGGRAPFDLRVRAADLSIRRTYAVPDASGGTLGVLRFAGEGDAWGRVRSDGSTSDAHYTARIRSGRVTGFDRQTSWDETQGWVVLEGGESRVLTLECGAGERRITVAGAVPGGAAAGPGAIRLDSTDPQVASLLKGIVPARWDAVREALGLAGRGAVQAEIVEPDERAGVEGGARIGLRSDRLKPSPLPLPLTDLEADVFVHPSGFELPSATASYGAAGRIRMSGRGEWGAGKPASTEFAIRGEGFSLTPEFLDALPRPLARVLRNLRASGDLVIDLDKLRMTGGERGDWFASGRLEVTNGALEAGLALREVEGALWGACGVRPDGELDLDANLSIDSCTLLGRPAERWEGRIVRAPRSRWLRLEGLRGRCADGEMFGEVKFDVETSAYELSMTLSDVSLEQLFALGGSGERAADGRVDGTVFLRGRGADPDSRVGGGELRVRSASLLSVPATAPLVGAGPAGRGPRSGAVHEAYVQFAWMGSQLRLTRVDINASDARLVGAGSWDLETQRLDLTLLGARPERAPRLFPLTDLLDLANEELAQFRIVGPVSDPDVRVELLHNVTEPLRRLFGAE